MTIPRQEHIEMYEQHQSRLVLKGHWLYDNRTLIPVQVFAINYDYYYEMDKQYDRLEDGEKPELNEDGEMYMVAWHNNKYFSFAGTVDYGGLTLEEAKTSAENIVKHIEWI